MPFLRRFVTLELFEGQRRLQSVDGRGDCLMTAFVGCCRREERRRLSRNVLSAIMACFQASRFKWFGRHFCRCADFAVRRRQEKRFAAIRRHRRYSAKSGGSARRLAVPNAFSASVSSRLPLAAALLQLLETRVPRGCQQVAN